MKKKLPEPETINFTLCSCGTELLMIDYNEEDQEWYLVMFERGTHNNNKLTFWQRIRWGLNILKFGKPYTDEICLSREKISELVNFLAGTLTNKKNGGILN